jgi:hypothetical protein
MKIWGNIWNSQVSPKVNIFAWKLSLDILPTKLNKFKCRLDVTPICDLCGAEPESSHQAVIECPHAKALWDTMRHQWALPIAEHLKYTGKDWFLLLLDSSPKVQRDLILLLMWR